jgi:hypothetical protein
MGDMRITSLWTPYRCPNKQLDLGAFITLPTAHAFLQGLIGGSFCKTNCVPRIDLKDILCSLFPPGSDPVRKARKVRADQRLIEVALGVLDHLTANVATVSLGNNGHVTIAPLARWQQRFNDYFGIQLQGSVQYVAPADEDRFFIHRIVPSEFQRDFDDPKKAESNLHFIERLITQTLFPRVVRVKVQPGPIVDLTATAYWNYKCAHGTVGYDFWWQGKEKFVFNNADDQRAFASRFLVNKALNSPGLQHKFFGSVGVAIPADSGIFHIGIRGDVTFASKGIGRDLTVALNLEYLF